MRLEGFTKLTLKDYPGHIGTICFTKGCPLRCPYCHNPDLVLFNNKKYENNLADEFLSYIEDRKRQIEGVVISGGEPLRQRDLEGFLREIKKKGLKIKLDTNGLYPDYLKKLTDKDLVDYIALDYKSSKESFARVVGLKSPSSLKIAENHYKSWLSTLNYLRGKEIPYEIRTTVVRELHSFDTLLQMAKELNQGQKKKEIWYLQSFEKSGQILNDYTCSERELSAYSTDEMLEIAKELSLVFSDLKVRE